jgi:hypothetical protein
MMTKYIAGLFNGIILILEAIGLADPHSILHWFMSITPKQMLIHLSISLVLILYAVFPQVRTRLTQIPIFLGGVGLLVAGICAIFSPNFFGYNSDILLVVDIFFLIELGILSMLIALELPIRHLKSPSQETEQLQPHLATLKPHRT